jgi:hypothetical protein
VTYSPLSWAAKILFLATVVRTQAEAKDIFSILSVQTGSETHAASYPMVSRNLLHLRGKHICQMYYNNMATVRILT